MTSPWSPRVPMSPSHHSSNMNSMTKGSQPGKFSDKEDGTWKCPPSPSTRRDSRQPSPSPRHSCPSPRHSFSSPRTRPPLTPPCSKSKAHHSPHVKTNGENDPEYSKIIKKMPSLVDLNNTSRSEDELDILDRYTSQDESETERYCLEENDENGDSSSNFEVSIGFQKMEDSMCSSSLQEKQTMSSSVLGYETDGIEMMLHSPRGNKPIPSKDDNESYSTRGTGQLWQRRMHGERQKRLIIPDVQDQRSDSPTSCVTPQASNRSNNMAASSGIFFPGTSRTPNHKKERSFPPSPTEKASLHDIEKDKMKERSFSFDKDSSLPSVIPIPISAMNQYDHRNGPRCPTELAMMNPNGKENIKERSFSFDQDSSLPSVIPIPTRAMQRHDQKVNSDHQMSMMFRSDGASVQSIHEVRISQLVTEIDEQDQVIRVLKDEVKRKDKALSKMSEALRQAEEKIAKMSAQGHPHAEKEHEAWQDNCTRTSEEESEFNWVLSGSNTTSNMSGKSSKDLESVSTFLLGSDSVEKNGDEVGSSGSRKSTTKDMESLLHDSLPCDGTEKDHLTRDIAEGKFKGVAHAQAEIIHSLRKDLSTTKSLLSSVRQSEQSAEEELELRDEELKIAKDDIKATVEAMEKLRKEFAESKISFVKMENKERMASEEIRKKEDELKDALAKAETKTTEIEKLREELAATKKTLKETEVRENRALELIEQKETELKNAADQVEAKIIEIGQVYKELTASKEALRVFEEKEINVAKKRETPVIMETDTSEVGEASPDKKDTASNEQEMDKLRLEKEQEIKIRKKTELEFQSALRARVKETQHRKDLEKELRSCLSDRAKDLEHQLTIEKNLKEERQRSRELQRKAVSLKKQLKALKAEIDTKGVNEKLTDALDARDEELVRRIAAEEKLREITIKGKVHSELQKTSSSAELNQETKKRKEAEDKYLRVSFDLKKEVVRRTEAEAKVSVAEEKITALKERIEESAAIVNSQKDAESKIFHLEEKLKNALGAKELLEQEVCRLKAELEEREKGAKDELNLLREKIQKDVEKKKTLEEEISSIKAQLEKEKGAEDQLSQLKKKFRRDMEGMKILEKEVIRVNSQLEKQRNAEDEVCRLRKMLQKDAEGKNALEKEVSRIKSQLEKEIEQKSEAEEKFTILSVDWAKEVEARMKLEEEIQKTKKSRN